MESAFCPFFVKSTTHSMNPEKNSPPAAAAAAAAAAADATGKRTGASAAPKPPKKKKAKVARTPVLVLHNNAVTSLHALDQASKPIETPDRVLHAMEAASALPFCDVQASALLRADEVERICAALNCKSVLESVASYSEMCGQEIGTSGTAGGRAQRVATASAIVASASLVLDAVDQAAADPSLRAFCIVRPPGHHAGSSKCHGFCILNNVLVGACRALQASVRLRPARLLCICWTWAERPWRLPLCQLLPVGLRPLSL